MRTISRAAGAVLCGLGLWALFTVSGCGGGGGRGGSAAMAGLQVSASAANVPAGGQAVALTATVPNARGTVSWSRRAFVLVGDSGAIVTSTR